MDVKELMAFKPSQTPKRPAMGESSRGGQDEMMEDDPSDSYDARAKKRKLAMKKAQEIASRVEEEERLAMLEEEARQAKLAAAGRSSEALSSQEREKINKIVEEGADIDSVNLDEAGVKKILLGFEKKVSKNQEMRIKFPDQPDKFMMSEMELHDGLRELQNVSTVPHMYPIMVELNCVSTLLGLLSHDNTDIAVAAVEVLQELTDVDTLQESEEGAEALLGSLLENQVCSLMVTNMERLDETVKEEAEGVHNTLAIVENLVELKPEICKDVAEAGFMNWLVKKLKVKVPFDENKLYASEILSILLQTEPENRKLFGELDAIDNLLQQLAYFKRHDPTQSEETEMMENLFDALCSLLLENDNRDRFLKGEGLQLMCLMLREKKKSRSGALKVLSHALTGLEGTESCVKFVDILGLRTLFPLFMKTPARNKRSGVSSEEHEERTVSILASLLKNVTSTNNAGKQRERILVKFTENDHEKVDRLMELHDKYLAKVEASDAELDDEIKTLEGTEAELSEEEIYLKRLEGGLFTLQLVDYIILEISSCAPGSVKMRVMRMLSMKGTAAKTLRDVVREYAGNLGNTEEEDRSVEQEYLLSLVDKF